MPHLDIHLFGSPRIEYNRVAVKLNSRKTLGLLVYLAVTTKSYTRNSLINLLWPESSQTKGQILLRSSLYSIRKALSGRWMAADRDNVTFTMDSETFVDVDRFERLLAECETHGHGNDEICADCTRALTEAAGLYKNEFLDGFILKGSVNFDDWQLLTGENLHIKATEAYDRLACRLAQQQNPREGIKHARRWIELDQANEKAHRTLMELYASAGMKPEALRQYERCRKALANELSVEPTAETNQLYKDVKANRFRESSGNEKENPGARTLPRRLSRFIGRKREIEEIAQLLSQTSLLTLTGTAGCGKTRLAQEVASHAAGRFRHGLWFVDLTPLTEPEYIPSSIAATLGLIEVPDVSAQSMLETYFATKKALVILDNCEHLIAACAQLVDQLLLQCNGLKILATSREPLSIEGEFVWRVPSMATPDFETQDSFSEEELQDYDAVQLFVDRGTSASGIREFSVEDMWFATQICRQLDGIPLAIELAAARLSALSSRQIYERLIDCFQVLTSDSRIKLPRHRTLRAAIDWSYELLTEKEKKLFCRLAAFSGGCSLDAIEAVCVDESGVHERHPHGVHETILSGEILYLVTQLVEKSLLLFEAGRYRLLEMIRQYARGNLPRDVYDDLRNRHRDWILMFVENAAPELEGWNQQRWLGRLEEEKDNIRSAVNWCRQVDDIDGGFRICRAMFFYWTTRGYYEEGRKTLELLLEHKEKAQEINIARGLFAAGAINVFCDPKVAFDYCMSCLAISRKVGNPKDMAYASLLVEFTSFHVGRTRLSLAYGKKAIRLMRRLGDAYGLAFALGWYGLRLYRSGRSTKRAKAAYEEGLVVSRQSGEGVMHCSLLYELAMLEIDQRDFRTVRERLYESLAIAESLGYRQGSTQALIALSSVEIELRFYENAMETARKAILLSRGMGLKVYIVKSIEQFIRLAAAEEKWDRAARILAGLPSVNAHIKPESDSRFRKEYEACRGAMSQEAFETAWNAGGAVSMDQLIDCALEEN
jgi:predicted ATPase/DNA-binding SARP family transcriptional activator